MLVKKKLPLDSADLGEVMRVYDFYEKDNRKYYVVSPKLCNGLLVFNSDQLEVVDEIFDDSYFFYNKNGFKGYAHNILSDELLYEGLLENDQESYSVFIKKLAGIKN